MENDVIFDLLHGLCLLVSLLLLNLVKSRWRIRVPGTVNLQLILKMVKLLFHYVDLLQPILVRIQKELRLNSQKERDVPGPDLERNLEIRSRTPKSEEL